MTEAVGSVGQDELDYARRGMRSCLACRTAFPNHLALMKHSVNGCRKMRR
jgi:hypothetical protein